MSHSGPLDALIIGGGPAGLTVALTLARQLHTAVVFDSHEYRNAGAKHMHTVLTWDHKDPSDFRMNARQNILSGYQTIQFRDTALTKIQKIEEGMFEATDKEGQIWVGKKVVLCTGVTDIHPNIEGYDDCWVKGM